MPYLRKQTGPGGAVSQSYSIAPFQNNESIPSIPNGTPNAATQAPYLRSEPQSVSSSGVEFGRGPESNAPPLTKWEYESLFTNSQSDVQPSLAQSISPPDSALASPSSLQALPQYDIKYELGSPNSIDATLDYPLDYLLPPADFPSESNSTIGGQGKPLERKEIEARAREKMRRAAQKLRIALIPHLNSGHGLRGNADVMEYASICIQRQTQNVSQLRSDLSHALREINRLKQSSCGF